jgi:hypothetical protein
MSVASAKAVLIHEIRKRIATTILKICILIFSLAKPFEVQPNL